MHKLIVTIIRREKLDEVISALKKEQFGFTYHDVKGFCKEVHLYREDIHDRVKIEVISEEANVEKVKEVIMSNACCGLEGDGCLSVYSLEN
jgi:nitrogen regulatory protein PII